MWIPDRRNARFVPDAAWGLASCAVVAILFRELAKPRIGESLRGYLDYYRFPEQRDRRGPFNGQPGRVALFRYIFETLKPVALIETGTFLGATTDFLASFGRPVFTVEHQAHIYGFAQARLQLRRSVTIARGDSRVILRRWLAGPLRRRADAETLFFYLDARGNDELPVAEELAIVFGRCPRAICRLTSRR